jgi:glycosyltransferase involved in cell wall biosynthesis
VAIDARKLFDGGIGTYIRGLLGALAVTHPEAGWTALVDPAEQGRVRWPGEVSERSVRAGKYGLAEHVAVPAEARRAGAELLHAPHYTLPLGWTGPSVVTIHDLIHIRFPRFHPPGAALYARVVAGLAVRRARVVIADSEATRRDVIELLAAPGDKVRVVPLGVARGIRRVDPLEASAFRAERKLPEGFVLYVGARKRHKNLELLLCAWEEMHENERPPLVISGLPYAANDPLAALAIALGVDGCVRFAGELRDDHELSCLYTCASLLVQPSLAEGFGLPPLEAMACGTPVLSSDAGSLPEGLGDAAEFLPPRDPDAWAAAVLRLLSDQARRAELVERGLKRAATFTWERTSAATYAIYEEALAKG